MTKLFFLGACLVAVASQPMKAQTVTRAADAVVSGMTQTDAPHVVIVKLYRSGVRTGHILISRGSNNSEDIEFADNRPSAESEALQVATTKLYQQGYRLRSTLGSSTLNNPLLVFTKD